MYVQNITTDYKKNVSFFFGYFSIYLIRAEAIGATADHIAVAQWIFFCFAMGDVKEEKIGQVSGAPGTFCIFAACSVA